MNWKPLLAALALACFASSASAQLANPIAYTPPDAATRQAMGLDAARLLANPPITLEGETDLACTAVAIYHESRGESIQGQRAVASVVLQRTMVPDRWGSRPCEVVRPVQFTFMTGRWTYAPIAKGPAWETALRVALTIMFQGPDAELLGADHYHTNDVYPTWRTSMELISMIGNHRFYVDPDSVTKTREAGLSAGGMLALVSSPAAVGPGRYNWADDGTPTYTVGDGVRGLPAGATQDLYAAAWADPKPAAPENGGFAPVRGPDVDAIARAAVPGPGLKPTGSPLGLRTAAVDVAQNGFRPLGFGTTGP